MAKKTMKFRRKAVLSAISKYQRRKSCYVMSLNWQNGSLTIDGQSMNAISFGDMIIGNTSEFQVLGRQYAMVKIRGISIEAVCNNYTQGTNQAICMGQASDSIAFGNVRTQPNILLLSRFGKARAYFPISGEFTPTNSNQLFTNMVLIPMASTESTATYTLKVTFYLSFKTVL